jgi:hypothetical protein
MNIEKFIKDKRYDELDYLLLSIRNDSSILSLAKLQYFVEAKENLVYWYDTVNQVRISLENVFGKTFAEELINPLL